MISQNELLTDDDELKRLPYRSGEKKGNICKIQNVCFTQPSIFSFAIANSKAFRGRLKSFPLHLYLCGKLYVEGED